MSKNDDRTVTFWATEEQAARARPYGIVVEQVGSHYRYEQVVREYQVTVDEIYDPNDVLKLVERPLSWWERLFR